MSLRGRKIPARSFRHYFGTVDLPKPIESERLAILVYRLRKGDKSVINTIVESHITLGAGVALGASHGIDVSLVSAAEKSQTNPGNGSTVPPVASSHSQLNWQVMYTYRF